MAAKVVGLALGGGGLRGLAHVGVIQVLSEAGLEADLVAGTSMGSLVAAFYALGWSPETMEELSVRLRREDFYDPALKWRDLVPLAVKLVASFYGWSRGQTKSPAGLLRGDKLETMVRRITGDARWRDLQRPLAIMATDILSACPVVFAPDAFGPAIAGSLPGAAVIGGATLAEACRCSTAVPGVFAPRRLEGRLLVDGGVSDNVPVAVLRAMGADLVVAVDVAKPPRREADALWEVVAASFEVVSQARVREQLSRHADVVIRPVVPAFSLLDTGHAAESIEAGRAAARSALPDILRQLDRPQPDRGFTAAPAAIPPPA
ncbi:MAG: patatin-like phospholipase family protein [Bacillota bacterium]